jgi:methionine aminopeptidase
LIIEPSSKYFISEDYMIRIKNSEQIEGIRESCRLLAAMFDMIEPEVKAGVTPKQLDGKCYEFISDHGATPAFLGYGGFPATLCTSVNHAVIHGIPDDRPLESGDVMSIDCGINLKRLYIGQRLQLSRGRGLRRSYETAEGDRRKPLQRH